MTISEAIKYYRNKEGLTQKGLAERTGLSIGAIQGYEQGKYTPKIENIEKIARALGVRIKEIKNDLTFEEHMKTRELIELDNHVASWQSIITFLIDIYGDVETIDVDKGTSCGFLYLVGNGENKFILHAEDIDALCDATCAAIPHLVNRLKDDRTLEEFLTENKNVNPAISTKNHKDID